MLTPLGATTQRGGNGAQRIRKHLTYANVMVTLVAFVVLGGGGAMAATTLIDGSAPGTDSVGSLDVIDGQITKDDIARNAVATKAVKDDSLTGDDIAEGTLQNVVRGRTTGTGAQTQYLTSGQSDSVEVDCPMESVLYDLTTYEGSQPPGPDIAVTVTGRTINTITVQVQNNGATRHS